MDQLSLALLEMYPLPDGVIPATVSGLPPPRVAMKLKDGTDSSIPDPLSLDKQYHTAKLRCNRRMTSPDWYQDVRHIEFSCDNEIRYDPVFHSDSNEVIVSVTIQETWRSSTRKFHLRMSILFYQRWAGQISPIHCIPLIFHYEVGLERFWKCHTSRQTSRSNTSRSSPTFRYVEDDFHSIPEYQCCSEIRVL